MPDLAGPIQALELASWLWLIPFFALAGALINVAYASGPAARVAVGSLGLSTLAALLHAALLFRQAPADRFLLDHVWPLVRVGQLDVGFDLALDPLAAALVVLVTVAGTGVSWGRALRFGSSPGDPARRSFAWLGAFVGFLVIVLLADNLLLLFMGWGGAGVAGEALVREGDAGSRQDRQERVAWYR
jgi:NADH-quinone oxidoreductase subunit L